MKAALALVLVLAVVAPAAASSTHARVWLSAERPLTVRGTGFAARDRVAVRVTKAGVVFRRTVTASAAGRFAARWARGLPTACGSTRVVAAGSSGRRATYTAVVDDCGPNDPTG